MPEPEVPMECPACGRTIDEADLTCPHCRAEIVPDAAAPDIPESSDMVRVRECLGLSEAEQLARTLDAAGIPFFLNNENMASLFPGAMGGVSGMGLGRVVILVPDAYADEATAVIARALADLKGSAPGS